tara:strand:+ start:3537 stop:3905 length:369 start_codon:yes stop_codon:yes gene_type:complete
MQDKEIYLFSKGIRSFNNKKFYDAHEYWEELWLEYKLKDAKFIQGLIQLAVSYFHYFNDNLKGARSMLAKSQLKFKDYKTVRGIDVECLLLEMSKLETSYDSLSRKLYNKEVYIISLKVIHE